MANRYSNLVVEIGHTIQAALSADGLHKEIELHQVEVIDYLQNCQFSKAAAALGEVATLIAQEGFLADAAAVRFAEARAYAKLPEQIEKCYSACHAALSLAEKVGNKQLRAEVCLFMAQLDVAHENFSSAYFAAAQAINLFEKLDNQTEKLILCYHLQAGITAFLLMFEQSRKNFMVAHALAKMGENSASAKEIQQHRSAAIQLERGDISIELLSHLMTATIKSGRREITSYHYLHSALTAAITRDYPAALKFAEKSLEQCRSDQMADGFIRYLLASLVLAEIHEAEKNRLSVLKVILRCKAYLENNFNNSVGIEFVKQYLNSLHERWGKSELKDVVEKYYMLALARQTDA